MLTFKQFIESKEPNFGKLGTLWHKQEKEKAKAKIKAARELFKPLGEYEKKVKKAAAEKLSRDERLHRSAFPEAYPNQRKIHMRSQKRAPKIEQTRKYHGPVDIPKIPSLGDLTDLRGRKLVDNRKNPKDDMFGGL